jgi:hypothetical protein
MKKWLSPQMTTLLIALLAALLIILNWLESLKDEHQTLQGSIQQLERENGTLKSDLGYLKENQKRHDTLVAGGWHTTLDRFKAGQKIEELSGKLNQVGYTIHTPEEGLEGTTRHKTHLTFTALLDSDVFDFLDTLSNKFPGLIQLRDITLVRQASITDDILKDIRDGLKPDLVVGEVQLDWIYWDHENIETDTDGGVVPAAATSGGSGEL